MEKPREWTLRLDALVVNNRDPRYDAVIGDEVHVIEKSAYDELVRAADFALLALNSGAKDNYESARAIEMLKKALALVSKSGSEGT